MYYFVSSPGWGCMLKPFLLLWKKVKMANVKMFCHLIWKTFRHLDMANSIKTALWTCNLWTSKSVSYKSANWFQLNLPPQISKVFPIFKCISFAILTFAIIEEITYSTNYRDWMHSCMDLSINWFSIKGQVQSEQPAVAKKSVDYFRISGWLVSAAACKCTLA